MSIWHANCMLDLNGSLLDAMLEQNTKEPTINFWKTIEACPLQMVYPPLDDKSLVTKTIVTTKSIQLKQLLQQVHTIM